MQGHCCFLAVMQAGCFLLTTNIFVIDKVIDSLLGKKMMEDIYDGIDDSGSNH
ncbi:MAG: hypothetical protein IPP29_18545 [Bacteroidetes bacterium]|nr:hypothetical protein [Bacteroidota bacterium]